MRKNRKNSQGNFIINLINRKTARYDVLGENYSSPYFYSPKRKVSIKEKFILPTSPRWKLYITHLYT